METKTRATIDDLGAISDKAELVDGKIQPMPRAGFWPNRAGLKIVLSLSAYERETGSGFAITDNAGFRVDLPNRQSFSPDAAYYVGEPSGMKFLEGAPIFAVEVRSEGDYGPRADEAIRRKRDEYCAAGTVVVWDVELLADDVVRSYRAVDPEHPTIFRRGETAGAEPALPGWRLPVDDLFG
jgi:Uma2 family endonuclease